MSWLIKLAMKIIMKMMKSKKIYLSMQAIMVVVFTVLGGLFIPRSFLNHRIEIGTALIAVCGIAITLFTFIQGLVQSTKTNLMKSNVDRSVILKKYDRIDSIINHLAGDVKIIVYTSAGYIGLNLFFAQLSNSVWQSIMVYIQYCLFGIIALALNDLIKTMFKLVEINELLNKMVLLPKEEGEKKDGK